MFFDYEDYVRNSPLYQNMLISMQCDVDDFMKDFKDDPRFLSGWGHGYFCKDDGGRLIYDRSSPLQHRCSICGKVYTDYIYSSYFITMYRNEAVETAVKAAVLYRIKRDTRYLEAVKKIVGFYADNYKYFAIHAKEKINCSATIDVGGAGKMMPQGLNEAIVAIRFLNALEIVKDELDKEWILDVKTKFFEPVYELLLPQKMHIHNIPIWLNSAFGIMGLFFNNEEWLNEATVKPFNIYEQLDNGLTQSGFWYEGSIHYNFFALEGLMTFYVFAKTYDYEIPQEYLKKVELMLYAAYDYAFDNDIFPNPSDGWPDICLKTYSYIYFMGYKVYGNKLLPLINHITAGKLKRARLPLSEPYYFENRIPLAQLLYAADYKDIKSEPLRKRSSVNFMDFNCAVLRNDVFNVFLKYGHQTKSHAHPDKMNVEIMIRNNILTRDISNSGYGTDICNSWDRTIAAHNTCAVNAQPSDVTRVGKIVAFDEKSIEAETESYDGVLYNRKLRIDNEKLTDIFTVNCEKESNIDWFFHLQTPADKKGIKLVKDDYALPEYPKLMNVRYVDIHKDNITLRNDIADITINLEKGARLYIADTYDNPADRFRETLIIRKKDKSAVFSSVIKALPDI